MLVNYWFKHTELYICLDTVMVVKKGVNILTLVPQQTSMFCPVTIFRVLNLHFS